MINDNKYCNECVFTSYIGTAINAEVPIMHEYEYCIFISIVGYIYNILKTCL